MGPQRIRFAFFGSALVLAVLLLVFVPRMARRQPGIIGAKPPAPAAAYGSNSATRAPAAAGGEEPSRLADGLNSPTGNARSDMRLIDQMFIAYRSALRTGNPVGENREITAALTGKNELGFAFIPPGNPAINSKGELCDRWGTPYFFHQMSGEKMEIRSAGPDHKLWTADDEVLMP